MTSLGVATGFSCLLVTPIPSGSGGLEFHLSSSWPPGPTAHKERPMKPKKKRPTKRGMKSTNIQTKDIGNPRGFVTPKLNQTMRQRKD